MRAAYSMLGIICLFVVYILRVLGSDLGLVALHFVETNELSVYIAAGWRGWCAVLTFGCVDDYCIHMYRRDNVIG